MIRFHASLLVLFASACGGEVGVGTLANDAGPAEKTSNTPNTPNTPASCPSGPDVETLYTTEPNRYIADFVSNGSLVVAAVERAGQTSRTVTVLPSTSPRARSTDTDLGVLLVGTRNRFFFNDAAAMQSEPWDGGDSEVSS